MNLSLRLFRVWRRDFDVYLRTWYVNFLPPLIEPFLYLFAFGIGLGSMLQDIKYQGQVVSYLAFIAPGVLAITIMMNSYYECLYGSFVRMYYQKTFDAIVTTPLCLEDVIGGEIVWGATKGIMASTIMMIPISFFGVLDYHAVLLIPIVALIGGMLFAAFGMCFTAICPTIDTFNFPVFLLITPMMLFSGTFFPLDVLPGWAKVLAYCMPLTHLAELIRCLTLGIKPFNLFYNVGFLLGGSVILFPVALVLMRRRIIQ